MGSESLSLISVSKSSSLNTREDERFASSRELSKAPEQRNGVNDDNMRSTTSEPVKPAQSASPSLHALDQSKSQSVARKSEEALAVPKTRKAESVTSGSSSGTPQRRGRSKKKQLVEGIIDPGLASGVVPVSHIEPAVQRELDFYAAEGYAAKVLAVSV